MGMSGVSKSQVSRLCEEIDGKVTAFLDRPIEGDWPYLWVDATYLKVRRGGRIVSVAVIIAVGVNTDGRREVLGMEVGTTEAEQRSCLVRLGHDGHQIGQSVAADQIAEPEPGQSFLACSRPLPAIQPTDNKACTRRPKLAWPTSIKRCPPVADFAFAAQPNRPACEPPFFMVALVQKAASHSRQSKVD
jgi:hypothetical protein